MVVVMKMMAAGKFKAQCLKVIDRVNATGEPVIITKKGPPDRETRAHWTAERGLFWLPDGHNRNRGRY